jgi:murein DD-endopeptidase MepM/ murein hydrolase activator NlpD
MPTLAPLSRAYMTSAFGNRLHPILGTWRAHSGVDLAAPLGSPIAATSNGRVNRAGWNGGYGLYIAVDHPGGVETRYGHMSRLNVVEGQTVRRGDIIGFVGSTGQSTGPHLHYEVRLNGRAVDPGPSVR